MLILPYNADLGLNRKPILTFIIVALCLLIHFAQDARREAIDEAANQYCANITQRESVEDAAWVFSNELGCRQLLTIIHEAPNPQARIDHLVEYIEQQASDIDPQAIRDELAYHYDEFRLLTPRSLDALLVYDPGSFNPITMITAAFAHGDWMHVIFNLIFFFAFAASIEVVLDSPWRYALLVLGLAFITHIVYSLSVVFTAHPLPTLGLSGVVSGMIGLFAYLMPRARIRTILWFVFYVKTISLRAWILAAWFIGWDMYNLFQSGNSSGINLIAHVSGGVGGYLIGMYFLRARKEEIQPELEDEIEHRRAMRSDGLGMLSSYTGGSERLEAQERQRLQDKSFEDLLTRAYRLATTNRASEGIALLIDELPRYGETLERSEEVFERLIQWPPNRVTLDFARIYIARLLAQHNPGAAIDVCERSLKISPQFRLGDPHQAITLASHAREQGQFDLAYALLRDFEQRYDGHGDTVRASFLEATLLWEHLDRKDTARAIITRLLTRQEHALHARILHFARLMASG